MSKDGLKPTPFYDLVNVRMYPEFEQDLAMALGEEFDSDSINAYQRVDFVDDCYISKKYFNVVYGKLRVQYSTILTLPSVW